MPSDIIKARGENLAPWKQIQEHPKQSGRRLGGINLSKGQNLLSLNPSKTLNGSSATSGHSGVILGIERSHTWQRKTICGGKEI